MRSLMISQHRDSAHNNKNIPFDFTPENKTKVADILSRYPSNYKAVRFKKFINQFEPTPIEISILYFSPRFLIYSGCHHPIAGSCAASK
jgi:hypothetical protein